MDTLKRRHSRQQLVLNKVILLTCTRQHVKCVQVTCVVPDTLGMLVAGLCCTILYTPPSQLDSLYGHSICIEDQCVFVTVDTSVFWRQFGDRH